MKKGIQINIPGLTKSFTRLNLGKVIIICFVFSIFTCVKSGGQDYVPLTEGSQFEYSIEYAAPFIGIKTAKMISRVKGTENINGKDYYKVVNAYSGIPGAESEIIFCRKAKEGIYIIEDKLQADKEYLDTPFPLDVGKKWVTRSLRGTLENIVEKIETLELFNRTYYDCFKVSYKGEIESEKIEGYYYLAKDIGMVKHVAKREGMTLDFTLVDSNKN